MSKQITARQAQLHYIMSSKNVLEIAAEKAAQHQMKETIKLVKTLKCRGKQFSAAVKIAKRAYRMGVRSVFAN